MGAWGTSLYANDTTCDIRGDYVDKLRRGKSNKEVTQWLIEQNQDIMGDVEEEPLFWFALADTQWNYGRLLPEVKDKALYFLSKDDELERWRDSGQKQLDAWVQTRNKLKDKLLSPMPPEKKVSKYRIYKCQWQFGDVFAYKFSGEYSKEKGFWGQYVVFRKVSEDIYWPGHIIPVVQVYKWTGKEMPQIDCLNEFDLLVQNMPPIALLYNPDRERKYMLGLISSSKRVIPENNLTFLGNIPGDDFIPYNPCQAGVYWNSDEFVGWEGSGYNKTFESYIIDMYLAWKDID